MRWNFRKIFPYILVILLAFLCSQFFFQFLLIQGDSMEPSYHHLQPVVVSRFASDFQRGDVVYFYCDALRVNLIKRIAAVPGDRLQIRHGQLFVNDRPSSIYPRDSYFAYAGRLEEPIILAADQYFMIGDNVQFSIDSRSPDVGPVSRSVILGRVLP